MNLVGDWISLGRGLVVAGAFEYTAGGARGGGLGGSQTA